MSDTITISRRALRDAIREAAAQGTDREYAEASVLDYIDGIVEEVLPPLLAGTGSAATYDLVMHEQFFRRTTLTVDAVTACEIALRGKGAVDGSQVATLWAAGRFEEIREYNADDVACARSIWCRITGEDDPADAVRKAA